MPITSRTVPRHSCGAGDEDHLEMISMPMGDGLTWFLCGGVDGRRLRPRASCIESSHREVVHCVRFQPCDVHQRVVSRYAHFANSVRLGVVFPVHNLLGEKEEEKTVTDSQTDSSGAFHCIIEIQIPS